MPASDLDLLLDAAQAAGLIALRYFKTSVDVWDKKDGQGPVSKADLEIDAMLREKLLSARPGYGWLSEETEDDLDRLNRDTVFIVDPIDGTRAFIEGHENFATSLALAKKNEIAAAVVHCPAKGLTYHAALGQGAFLNHQPIRHSGMDTLKGARVLATQAQMRSNHWMSGPPPVNRHFRSSLAYRLSCVAEGRFDGMFTFRDTCEWDVAGGDLICREAGATVSDISKNPLCYNQSNPMVSGIIAAAPVVYDGIVAHLK